MPDNPNKLIRFWHELKRRKVIKVITVYAAAAFVILELVDIVSPALLLPSWTVTLVIVLLSVGFPIAIILSWIFDVTPEGIRKTEAGNDHPAADPVPEASRKKIRFSDLVTVVLIAVVVILLYPKIFGKDKFSEIRDADGRISIAVMPFENLTGDTTLNWFEKGISSLIINGLGNSSELAVLDDHTMFEAIETMNRVTMAGISPSQAKEVARQVNAETYITGSCQGQGGNYWILANLVDTESGNILWTHRVEGDLKSSGYLDLANTLCHDIKNYLEIKVLEKEADFDFQDVYPKSAEAYRYFIEGMNLISTQDYVSAIESLKKALEIDSTFTFASFYIAYAYDYGSLSPRKEETMIYTEKAYKTRDKLPSRYQNWIGLWHACYFTEDLEEMVRYCNLLEESGSRSRFLWFDIGATYHGYLNQYDKAVTCFETIEKLNSERDGDWEFALYYDYYGRALHETGNHEKEIEINELGAKLFPNNTDFLYNQAVCLITQGDTSAASNKFDEMRSMPGGELTESVYARSLGNAYESAGRHQEAEVCFRKAYELAPLVPVNCGRLAYVLIEHDMNIDEGMELLGKGLELDPQSAPMLAEWGRGLLKQGKPDEALDYLQRADELIRGPNIELNELIREAETARAGL